jgi:aerobic-type carbon monoxide dehydrogenase small subunit (CoxS/CutS family)
MIITAAALLEKFPSANEQEIVDGMNGNICRCCTYPAIIKALEKISQKKGKP